ncbi:hypothetical protein WSM22_19020 [Cytophagales bacterium WSM2-2]|nr:hypothetical protein WSM22_19020 [Cytophagales bacterium WSM2-2]
MKTIILLAAVCLAQVSLAQDRSENLRRLNSDLAREIRLAVRAEVNGKVRYHAVRHGHAWRSAIKQSLRYHPHNVTVIRGHSAWVTRYAYRDGLRQEMRQMRKEIRESVRSGHRVRYRVREE